jgi:hypothetical protein
MALTIFLFKVSNLDNLKNKPEVLGESQETISSQELTTQTFTDESAPLLNAKVIFRGMYIRKYKREYLFCETVEKKITAEVLFIYIYHKYNFVGYSFNILMIWIL